MSLFSKRLANWQAAHGRNHLPWQCQDPYCVWLSEIMLQQTQVSTVLTYYPRFLAQFPTISALATADFDDVSRLWAGLGYYSRARNLHRAAQTVCEHWAGVMPTNRADLEQLSGIGRSTAAAICVFAYGQKEAILDGNVKRVLARHAGIFGEVHDKKTQVLLWTEAEKRLPDDSETLRRYTQGLMDLGSLICTRSRPKCGDCPVISDCYAYKNQKIDQLPTKKTARAAKPEKSAVFLLATCNQKIHLYRRPDQGIWRNLWSLPEFPDQDSALTQAASFGKVTQAEFLPTIRHAFTHYILHIQPLRVELARENGRAAFFTMKQAQEKGMPAPIAKLLAELNEAKQMSLF